MSQFECPCHHAPDSHSARGCRLCTCDWRQIKVGFGDYRFSQPPPKLFGREMMLMFRSSGDGERFSVWRFGWGGIEVSMDEWDEMGCISRGLVDKVSRAQAVAALEGHFRDSASALAELVNPADGSPGVRS